jgi:hypothetical protein
LIRIKRLSEAPRPDRSQQAWSSGRHLIIGPELGDRTTIAFAKLLPQKIGGFTPPTNYA